ncbi:hypothetical protein OH76DRAFT_305237 [Lentinus brumalis]|uniref:Uncharacterized protein n=1 Tax=Lentinus brumalis TaxID=2498619 RepID=A0A371CKE8_9APHY|nr:hypothetical protein OH76DRAFT_305237 [Polyporus brumalis]
MGSDGESDYSGTSGGMSAQCPTPEATWTLAVDLHWSRRSPLHTEAHATTLGRYALRRLARRCLLHQIPGSPGPRRGDPSGMNSQAELLMRSSKCKPHPGVLLDKKGGDQFLRSPTLQYQSTVDAFLEGAHYCAAVRCASLLGAHDMWTCRDVVASCIHEPSSGRGARRGCQAHWRRRLAGLRNICGVFGHVLLRLGCEPHSHRHRDNARQLGKCEPVHTNGILQELDLARPWSTG